MTYCVSGGVLNSTHSLTHFAVWWISLFSSKYAENTGGNWLLLWILESDKFYAVAVLEEYDMFYTVQQYVFF